MNDQVRFTADELLATQPGLEPLDVRGLRCHGGYDADGTYVSPRTLHRVPAIEAWRHQHARSGAPLLDVDLHSFPGHYPNVAQARLLLRNGVRDPIIATLTRVGTVEGFGSFLRFSLVNDLQRHVADDIAGTALGHLESGLIEAHARDEAGHDGIAGHDRMWFAARDIAFEDPVTEDQTALMLERLGVKRPGAATVDLAQLRRVAEANRKLPADIAFEVEALLERMCSLLLIEVTAFHLFGWAEELLSERDLVAGDGEAARIVSHIRADETPHVEYLVTALSELQARSLRGAGGRAYDGAEVLAAIWEPAVEAQQGARRDEVVELTRREVERAVLARTGSLDLLEEFDALADPTDPEV